MLEPMRKRMVAVFEDLDLSSPPAGDPLAIFDTADAFERDGKRMERILRRGARLVDSPRKLRKATIDALLTTRPYARPNVTRSG
jgi:hypothetical protein